MTTAVKSNTLRPNAWQQWLDKPRVRLWEAIALSLGIDPGQVSREAGAGWAGWEVGVETSNLVTDAAAFRGRLKQACSHAEANGGTLKLHPPVMPAWGEIATNDLINHTVGLADFVRWAISREWNLPSQLLTLSTAPSRNSTSEKSNTEWIARAREIAQEAGEILWNAGQRQITARGVTGSVTTELAKDFSMHGLQGPRTEHNVRTIGLKGWKFQPPSRVKMVD